MITSVIPTRLSPEHSQTRVDAINESDNEAISAYSPWLFHLCVAEALPQIDLQVTPAASLLTPAAHTRFLVAMRRWFKHFGTMIRVSAIGILAMLFVERSIGRWLVIPIVVLSVPSLVCANLMMSSPLLVLLTRQFEFWYFTMLNIIIWVCFASFFGDIRVIVPVINIVTTEIIVLLDANFRTVTSALRSATMAFPALLLIAMAVFFQLMDVDATNLTRVLPMASVDLQIMDLFVNTAITMSVFVARKAYGKRGVLVTPENGLHTIRCVILRARLELQANSNNNRVCPHTANAEDSHSVVLKARDGSSSSCPVAQPLVTPMVVAKHEHEPPPPTRRTSSVAKWSALPVQHPCLQQITLVPMTLTSVDVRYTLYQWRDRSQVHAPATLPPVMSTVHTGVLLISGTVGIILTMLTLIQPTASHDRTIKTEMVVATTGLLSTLLCCVSVAMRYQCQLVRYLLKRFNFLFLSLQFTATMGVVADMLEWDHRALGTLSWWIWFHVVLFVDALTPPVKRDLRFRKWFALSVLMLSLAGLVLIVYGFFFAPTEMQVFLVERTLWQVEAPWQRSSQSTNSMATPPRTVALRTKCLLLNRVLALLPWGLRLAWELGTRPENELVLIRGAVEYYSPLEMFPPPTKRMRPSDKVGVAPVPATM